MDPRNNIATDLFYKIRSRFSGLKLGAETGEITIIPEQARFFDFDYMEGKTPVGHVSISLAEPNSMKVYFSHGITETMDDGQKDNWYRFLRELRTFAKRRLLNFDTRDIAKDNLDQRDYAFLSQQAQNTAAMNTPTPVGESIMSESAMYGSKTMSYQKLLDTRLIIKHSQAVMDDTQPGARTRHISALFVENQEGERFKYPFIHLSGARAMQRHVANGGLPYDEIGKSIIGMSEEIAQLKSFGNYVVRNDLMNSANNGIVEKSSAYLNNLREQLHRLSKQKHYEAYRESFQAQQPLEVPQDVIEDFTDKFTVRNFKEDIKSVFPVLYRLMQEESKVGYDDIVGLELGTQTNEDVEVDTTPEAYDPFEKFESWAMGLGEESAIQSQDPDEQDAAIQELQVLLAEPFPAGVDGTNAIESLKGIINDPQLEQQIKELARQDSETDVGPLIKDWLETNAPDALEAMDSDETEEPMPQDPQADADAYADADAEAYGTKEAAIPKNTDVADRKEKLSKAGAYTKEIPKGTDVVDRKEKMAKLSASGKKGPLHNVGKGLKAFLTGKPEPMEGEEKSKPNVKELAEFIHSFYDKESQTFPKGPEGVAIMVGKKFGEEAEKVARQFVERMAPQQSSEHNTELAELARIKQLSGIQQSE